MNKQLLRLKQRSNGDIIQVAQSDDDNNLYVNIDAGTLDELTHVTNIDSVDLITEVNKSVSYGTDDYGNELALLTDTDGHLSVDTSNHIHDTLYYQTGYNTIEAGSTPTDVIRTEIPYDASYKNRRGIIGIANFSGTTELNVTYNIAIDIDGITTHVFRHGIIAPYTRKYPATSTAWSSAVEYNNTGTVYTDYSNSMSNKQVYTLTWNFNEVGDALYFGAPFKFNQVEFLTEIAGVFDATITWEYWDGNSWDPLTILKNTTGTTTAKSFTVDNGVIHSVVFITELDWVANIPDGVNMESQYWVRARVSDFNSITIPPVIKYVRFKDAASPAGLPYEIDDMFVKPDTISYLTIAPNKDLPDDEELVYWIGVV